MLELPLFPLNTVLFPGMPLPLYIFEARYKEMVHHCLAENHPFGVALIQNGREALGPLAEPYPIGCTARITQVEPLGTGDLNILAVGQERFHIVGLDRDRPYLVGQVETVPLDISDPVALIRPSLRLHRWIVRYLEALTGAGLVEFDPDQLPSDPIDMAYLAATLLQIPTEQKQPLLSAGHATMLLANLLTLYRREVALLRTILNPPEDAQYEAVSFSIN